MKLELRPEARRKLDDIIKAKQCPTLFETTDCDGCPLAIFENERKPCAEAAADFIKLLESQETK
jgi:hypothetical protein